MMLATTAASSLPGFFLKDYFLQFGVWQSFRFIKFWLRIILLILSTPIQTNKQAKRAYFSLFGGGDGTVHVL